MQCPHCPETVPDDSVFCPECGKKIDTRTPASATTAAQPAQDRPPTATPAQAFAKTASPSRATLDTTLPAKRGSKGLWLAIAVIAAVGAIYGLANLGGSTDDPPPDNGGGDHAYRLVAEEETVWSTVEFNAAPGDRIVVRAEALEEGADPMVILRSENGAYVDNDDEYSGTLNAFIEFQVETDDYFYAEVQPVSEDNPGLTLFTVELNP